MNRFLSNVASTIWALQREDAEANLRLLVNAIKGVQIPFDASEQRKAAMHIAFMSQGRYDISPYGEASPPENAPKDSVAVIGIDGIVYKNDMFCGPVGMMTKINLLQRCDANLNIKGMVLKIESPGGDAYAAMHMYEAISALAKPVVAYVDDLAASAAMWIASACDHIVVNSELARVGSIGTYVTIADYTKAFEAEGIRLIDIYATKSTEKNKDYYEALKGNLEPIRKSVDRVNEKFLQSVKDGRGDRLAKDMVWNTGKLFFAPEAIEAGLIDRIDSLENTINNFY